MPTIHFAWNITHFISFRQMILYKPMGMPIPKVTIITILLFLRRTPSNLNPSLLRPIPFPFHSFRRGYKYNFTENKPILFLLFFLLGFKKKPVSVSCFSFFAYLFSLSSCWCKKLFAVLIPFCCSFSLLLFLVFLVIGNDNFLWI